MFNKFRLITKTKLNLHQNKLKTLIIFNTKINQITVYVCSRYVRQGVLYGLGMLIAATPAHTLLGELSTDLMEGVAWMKEVLSEDADGQSRMLAGHALTLLNAAMKES